MMRTIFDAYVMVDWSAASTPKSGVDSIWVCCIERTSSGDLLRRVLKNPATRMDAITFLGDLLSDLDARSLRTLVGFDFAFGYPAGFAKALGLRQQNWQGLWTYLSRNVRDGGDNANNRFELANRLNEMLGETPGPFWGAPKTKTTGQLMATKPGDHEMLAEMRLCEQRIKGVKSVWQLLGTGCVGSQTMMGIARLEELRNFPWLQDRLKVWPFETGLRQISRDEPDWSILVAEIYPSQIKVNVSDGQIKDALQVETLARHYAHLDEMDGLGELFVGDENLSPEERQKVEAEEGWVLGIGEDDLAKARRWLGSYIKKPDEIYHLSEKIIRSELDVSALDEDMREVAIRMVHACGDVSLIEDIDYSPGAGSAGRQALDLGAPIFVDVEMVARGIIPSRLPQQNSVICKLNDAKTPKLAVLLETTRSAAALDLWGPALEGSVVVIGNAPTALFRLLEEIEAERMPKPALIIGVPVGFVGAAESKECLRTLAGDIPYITVRGRRGGSAIAAAAVNALAKRGITQ